LSELEYLSHDWFDFVQLQKSMKGFVVLALADADSANVGRLWICSA